MTNEAIKAAKQAARKPGKVTTRKLTKAQLAARREAAGLTATPPKVTVKETVASTSTKPVAKKGNTPKAASNRDALRASVVKAYNASKISDPAKRRKAVAIKLDCRGQVKGLLREAGIEV
jgi:hypothetical protein